MSPRNECQKSSARRVPPEELHVHVTVKISYLAAEVCGATFVADLDGAPLFT
jgi:hypothetical protein